MTPNTQIMENLTPSIFGYSISTNQVKNRIRIINEVLNDMVDANMEFDQQETDNFDWELFNSHLEIMCFNLDLAIGEKSFMEFIESLVKSEPEVEEMEWMEEDFDRHCSDQEAYENSL